MDINARRWGNSALRIFAGVCALAVALALALAGMPQRARAQGSSSFAGIITDVKCSAELKEAGSDAAQPLKLGAGERRPVVSGEQIHCLTDGPGITVVVAGGPMTVKKENGWYTVRSGAILKEMTQYAQPAFTRGETPRDTIFYSPVEGGTVDPARLIVKWIPPENIGNVTIAIAPENSERPLCCKGMASGAAGVLDSPGIREALARYRDRGGAAPLELRMHDTSGNEFSVIFSVLTPPAQQSLDTALAGWKTKDMLVRHLGRASTFTAFGLYGDAADEYEMALKQSPDSSLLLEMTAEAEQRTGNAGRAAELSKKLEHITAKTE
jgi:hypothetical protein